MQKIPIFCKRYSYVMFLREINWKFIMRVSAIIIIASLTAVNLLIASPGRGQTDQKRISIEANNMTMLDIFKIIEQKADVVIMYESTKAFLKEKLTISFVDQSASDILDEISKIRHLKWTFRKNIYRIEDTSETPGSINQGSGEKSTASFFAVVATPIKGYVTDGDGNALVGATVTVKNSNTSTKAGSDGSFLISASLGDILVITFVGYDVREIKLSASMLKDRNIGTAELKILPSAMREVEVNKGYYSVKDKLNTGNVFTVKGEDIRKQPVSDPMMALEGRVPGLMIAQTAGVPGCSAEHSIKREEFY